MSERVYTDHGALLVVLGRVVEAYRGRDLALKQLALVRVEVPPWGE